VRLLATAAGATMSMCRTGSAPNVVALLAGGSRTASTAALANGVATASNAFVLLGLVMYIFALLGMQLFAKLQFNNTYNVHANFRTFSTSLLTLYRFSTGEAWDCFMYDAATQQPGCDPDPSYDPAMCGFNDQNGCVPLNGCGNNGIFAFMTIYIFIIVFTAYIFFT
jgi:hypothetical protein